MKKLITRTLISVFVLFVGFTVFTFSKIYRSVYKITTIAKNEFKEDAVISLINLIESDNYDFIDKNSAIWALGQLADKRALPFLEEINSEAYENTPCNRKKGICKREIEKAIQWCSKGNLTSWMYRKL